MYLVYIQSVLDPTLQIQTSIEFRHFVGTDEILSKQVALYPKNFNFRDKDRQSGLNDRRDKEG